MSSQNVYIKFQQGPRSGILKLAMNNKQITITIELETGKIAHLDLSPRSYKHSFRQFKKRYQINQAQAFILKNMIQAKLIQIAHPGQSQVLQTPKRAKEKDSGKESPRFRRPCEDQESQTDFDSPEVGRQRVSLREQPGLTTQYKKAEQLEEMPLTPVKTVQKKPNRTEKIVEKKGPQRSIFEQMPSEQRQSKQYGPPPEPIKPQKSKVRTHKKTISPYELLQISEQSLTSLVGPSIPQKKQKAAKQPAKLEPKPLKKEPVMSNIKLDRLYYESTDCFKSKGNKDINSKQVKDLIEVEKYELSNKLKRTTKEFFYHLHNDTTQTWESKFSPQKQPFEEEVFEFPVKKVSLEKAFKGSTYESKAFCAAKEYSRRLDAEDRLRAKEGAKIRKRMQEQQQAQHSQSKEKGHKSRACLKCSPKIAEQKSRSPISPREKSRKPKIDLSGHKKVFISTILQDSYQERCQKTRQLDIR